jgi:hypothetical protein
MSRELEEATVLQLALLPQRLPDVSGLRMDFAYVPAAAHGKVGGDWFDVFPITPDLLGISVGDVAGHGLQAASTMGMLRQTMRVAARMEHLPSRVLRQVNRSLCAEDPGALATALFATLDCKTDLLRWSTAELQAHNVALWAVNDLIALVRADAAHPIAWTELIPLLAAGRASERVTDFTCSHEHGARERTRLVLRFMLEEGLKYQRSLCEADTQVQSVNAPLSIDSLTLLVNQRLQREGDFARATQDHIRAAISIAALPLIGAVCQTGDAVNIISRATKVL